MTIFVQPSFFADEQRSQRDSAPKMPHHHNGKKKQARGQQLAPQPPPITNITSDYDTDTAYHTESQQALPVTAPPPNRSPAELNMLVLRRWYPAITTILAIAPFAVLYTFSPDSQSWEKHDTQGSLFVCQLSPLPGSAIPRYKVIILNRRNPKNFELDLVSTEDIEVTEEFIIIPYVDSETGEAHIYGIWVFRDEEGEVDVRSFIANVILECAGVVERAGTEAVHEEQDETEEQFGTQDHDAVVGNGQYQHENVLHQQSSTGQSIDLATLFAKPIQQHELSIPQQHLMQQSSEPTPFAPSADTAFFRDTSSPAGFHGHGTQAPAPAPGSQQNTLLGLFKNASKG